MQVTKNGDKMAESSGLSLCLLGAFSVELDGEPVLIPAPARTLLAILALNGGRAPRGKVVGTIWPEKCEKRALANLRTARFRLPPDLRSNVVNRGNSIALSDQWTIDLDQAIVTAERIHQQGLADGIRRQLFCRDLLPDWDQNWLVVIREQHRQLRLHALESLAIAELAAGRPLDAVDTALAAVASEPLRESAQFILLTAHLAAGNRAAAFRRYERFSELLATDLGVEPSTKLQELVKNAGWEPR